MGPAGACLSIARGWRRLTLVPLASAAPLLGCGGAPSPDPISGCLQKAGFHVTVNRSSDNSEHHAAEIDIWQRPPYSAENAIAFVSIFDEESKAKDAYNHDLATTLQGTSYKTILARHKVLLTSELAHTEAAEQRIERCAGVQNVPAS
ncbi:MAG: hypothetical protein E6G56_02830 [Actinobacteria bacterium]|nr:MAG: hypothetical protein E6G56_02830 [Actinomycetota bacterium]